MGVLPWFLSYAAGLCLMPYLPLETVHLGLIGILAVVAWAMRNRPWLFPASAGIFFFVSGLLFYSLSISPPVDPSHLVHHVDEEVASLHGRILDMARYPDGRGRIDLEILSLGPEGVRQGVHGRMQLFFGESHEDEREILPGDLVWLRTRLRHPTLFGSPGEFNYPRYLCTRNIHVTGYLKSLHEMAVAPQAVPWYSPDFFRRLRFKLTSRIFRQDDARSALTAALLVGDKSRLLPEQRETLARGGISHLFSISGLHLGLVAGYGYHLLLLGWRRSERLLLYFPPRRYLPLALIPLLLFYVMVTGGALPTLRAFFMAFVGVLLWLSGWRTRPLNLVWAVAFIFLLAQPLLIFDVSFQLSFAAVTAIVACVGRWSSFCRGYPRCLRWFCLLGVTTLVASLATLPLVLAHFHLLAPAGLLTNFIAVPVIALLALPLGLVAVAFLPLWPTASQWLLSIVHFLVGMVQNMVDWMINWPLLAGWRLFFSPWQIWCLALAVLMLMLPLRSRYAWTGRIAVIGLCMGGFLWCLSPSVDARVLTVTAVSVGQGDATLLSLGNRHHILVDGGGLYSDMFDVGERLVAPALGYVGVRRLDAVVLTHDHPDHRKGLAFILENFEVDQFWTTPSTDLSASMLGTVLDRRRIPVRHFEPGWTFIDCFAPYTLSIFQPPSHLKKENDRSLVIYAGLGEAGVMLTGDLERAGVEQLLLYPFPGAVCLLKMPHHGSAGSLPAKLIDYVQPGMVFVSAGRDNVYRLPAAEVLEVLREDGIPLLRTDTQGTLRWTTDGQTQRVEIWEGTQFRPI
ncbi:MAG: DNA internalization-related competence protein ComEC/Rec2 [Geoalkalibacter sp.]|jgi:competence protein ComEC|uniref:DNA internalization-related competence protein ComEC/Rec2 n=1 Tax=Geoalkalibacter sp. TaxID=3041440 RepID=UPI002A9733C0|nr:DNA internalization-related competence protein ComEC/Rec2 [Thermodesulfobacteriota bacterium]